MSIEPAVDSDLGAMFGDVLRRLEALERQPLSPFVSIEPDGTVKVLDSAGTVRVCLDPNGTVETFDAGGVSTGTLP